METKLCRICGKLGENYVNIFKTEGLKNKIETCLPIIVSPHSLLPDMICGECSENVDNFYSFIKNCLQNIIILEAQYDITDSCLKTKRKHEKSCHTDFTFLARSDKNTQTDDYFALLLKESESFNFEIPLHLPSKLKNNQKLVDYDIESDTNSETDDCSTPCSSNLVNPLKNFGRNYFDDSENYLIHEIAQRKNQRKRKSQDTTSGIESSCAKIFKLDSGNRRKSKQPKRCFLKNAPPAEDVEEERTAEDSLDALAPPQQRELQMLPQICLLCEEQFAGPSMLAAHVFETHGIDMAAVVGGQNNCSSAVDRKRKLPDLLKISDLARKDDETAVNNEEPPTLLPSFVCPLCPAVFTVRPDLFNHLRIKHPEQSALACGICLHQASTLGALQAHLEICAVQHPPTARHICQICRYSDDNSKTLENHILVHDFLLDACKKQLKMFDPADYILVGGHQGGRFPNAYSCTDCSADFDNFKEFSSHRRSLHSVFHCDLCNKSYGRNSHLWKHVNRLHKGHPSITCQLCYKTSASKYHLAQHFNKIHSSKRHLGAVVEPAATSQEDFLAQKFQAFDFQSVKQSFMRQEMIMAEQKDLDVDVDEDDDEEAATTDIEDTQQTAEAVGAPKEIDSSSNLYTNIITNYTPPVNEGEFKCPKCGKGFHKKTLLKKHKKNCRPRLQKDLLTRCKSCARIFKDRQSLAKHLVNYHSEYVCEICAQKVQSKCEIISHIRFSHPGCHLFCSVCGNILRSFADLEEHLRNHSDSYVCQFCADALPSKIKLKMHILSLHRKILSLSCGVCLKLFESQHVLREHVRLVHRDQLAPLTSCPVCGKNYGSKWKTYDHLNKSHGRIFKACKVCLELFDDETQLQTHYDSAHAAAAATGRTSNHVPQPENIGAKLTDSDEQEPELAETESNHQHTTSSRNGSHGSSNDDDSDFVATNSNKVSLLEKRLLMAKTVAPPAPPPKKSSNMKLANDEAAEHHYQQMNNCNSSSSKRTVYVNSNDPSFCEICFKTWPAKKHLWQHYIRCHKSVAATVCGICLKTNGNYGALQEHLWRTHPTLLHGQGFGSNFICRICGRYHNARSKLKLHMAIHENFDWTLLGGESSGGNSMKPGDEEEEDFEGEDEEEEDDDDDDEMDQWKNPNSTLGDDETKQKQQTLETNGYRSSPDNDINYDSLIEQVECSSAGSDDDEEEDEEEDDSSSDDSDEDSINIKMEDSIDVKLEAMAAPSGSGSSDDDDEEEDEVKLDISCTKDEEEQESNSNNSNNSCFSESSSGGGELDSAVQSIKFECIESTVEHHYDVMPHEFEATVAAPAAVLINNDMEIESAVGSIL